MTEQNVNISLAEVHNEQLDNLLIQELEVGSASQEAINGILNTLDAVARALDKNSVVINSRESTLEEKLPQTYSIVESHSEAGLTTAVKEL